MVCTGLHVGGIIAQGNHCAGQSLRRAITAPDLCQSFTVRFAAIPGAILVAIHGIIHGIIPAAIPGASTPQKVLKHHQRDDSTGGKSAPRAALADAVPHPAPHLSKSRKITSATCTTAPSGASMVCDVRLAMTEVVWNARLTC